VKRLALDDRSRINQGHPGRWLAVTPAGLNRLGRGRFTWNNSRAGEGQPDYGSTNETNEGPPSLAVYPPEHRRPTGDKNLRSY
jgi:hypothetical protein